jgi:hypothetical protein
MRILFLGGVLRELHHFYAVPVNKCYAPLAPSLLQYMTIVHAQKSKI